MPGIPAIDPTRVRKAGVDDGGIVEAVANTVAIMFTNYLNHVARNHVAGTDIDFPVVRARVAAAA